MIQLPSLQLDQALEKDILRMGGQGWEEKNSTKQSDSLAKWPGTCLQIQFYWNRTTFIYLHYYYLWLLSCRKSGDLSIQNIYCLAL